MGFLVVHVQKPTLNKVLFYSILFYEVVCSFTHVVYVLVHSTKRYRFTLHNACLCVPVLFPEDHNYKEPCPLPCDRTLFEPSLSYASLSHHNTKSVLFQGISDANSKVDSITQTFFLAKEIQQRVTRDIYDLHQDQISQVSGLLELVNKTTHTLQSTSYLAKTRWVKDVLGDGLQVMTRQYDEWRQLLAHRHRDLIHMIRNPFMGLGFIHFGYGILYDFLNAVNINWEDSELKSYLKAYTLVEAIQQCLNNNISMDVIVSNTDIELHGLQELWQYDSSVITNETFCIYYLQFKIISFKNRHAYAQPIYFRNVDEHFDAALLLYEAGLNDLLNDTGVYPQDFAEYLECVAEFNDAKESVFCFGDLFLNAAVILEQSTTEDFLAYAEYLTEEFENDMIVQAYEASKSGFENKQNDVLCNFPRRYSGEITQGSDEYLMKEAALSLMETAIKSHENAVRKYALILEEMDDILLIQDQQIVPIVGALKSYLAGHITKRELANTFEVVEAAILYPILQYDYIVSRFIDSVRQLRSALQNIVSYYKDAYERLWDLKIPVYTYSLLWESPLWSELLEPSANSSLEAIVSNITKQRPWPVKFHDMFDILFEPFLSYPSEQAAAIGNASKELLDVVMSYYNNLKRFREELIIDNAFYL